MRGHFEAVGERPFPLGENIRCLAYDWHCAPKFGRFKIRFLCPMDEEPRRFFMEAFLADLQRPVPSIFVDRACNCGAKILAKMEADLGIPQSEDKVWSAIFRQRNAGHFRLTRRFNDVTDFVGSPSPSSPLEVILPGVEAPHSKTDTRNTEGYERKKLVANTLLRTILPEKKRFYTAEDVLSHLQTMIQAGGVNAIPVDPALASVALDVFPHRGPIDSLLLDGVVKGGTAAEFIEVCQKVGGAVINGLSWKSDMRWAKRRLEDYTSFVNRIDAKARATPGVKEFDRWFKNEREHGFVRLFTTKSFAGRKERKQAVAWGKAFYRTLLWQSYEMMARCYGALILVAWLDFCEDPSIRPDDLEQILFRRMHAPQYYLAGLPVVFLGLVQLRFIAKPLLQELWAPEGVLRADAYLSIADILSTLAFLNVTRRAADRGEKKAGRGRPRTITKEKMDFGAPRD